MLKTLEEQGQPYRLLRPRARFMSLFSDASLSLRPRRWIIAAATLAIVCIALIGLIASARLRGHEISQAERNLRTLDLLLGEETERAIQSADLILRSFQEKISGDGVTTAEELQATEAKQETFEAMRSRLAGVPQVSAISVVAPDGHLIVSSRSFPAPTFNLSGRDYFQESKAGSAGALHLSQPVQNLSDGAWTAYLSRRINNPSGQCVGIITAAINLAYFEELYRTLDVGNGGAVSLWHSDGTLMARFPALPNGTGKKFAIKSFSGILTSDHAVTYSTSAAIDGTARVVSTIAAKQFPLVINVTATQDDILRDWRQTSAIIGAGCLFCMVAVLLVSWLLLRQIQALQALNQAQAERGAAVAARDHAEDQLRQAQKLDSIGQLTGGVAHDFNNLLTAVLGNLELLQKHGESQGPRYQRWTQNALEAAQRGAVLTQRLLAFSRRQPLSPTATDIVQLIRSMSDLMVRTLGENIKMELHLDPNLHRADVDPNQLDNAILNVAINARDAMAGQGTLKITAHNVVLGEDFCKRNPDLTSGRFVMVEISDSGCGIPPAVLEQVFEPFFTTKPIGQGTGLGLSQVYGFVKQTGGHIELDSTVGVGTRVVLYLPCARDDAAPVREGANVVPEISRAGLRVLVVEDDAVVLSYSLEMMQELGFQTTSATNADEALATMRAGRRFDLLFTDVGLPGLNGYDLAGRAREMQPDLRVLFASGYANDVLMHQGRLEKGVQLLSKPFTGAQLRAKLNEALNGYDLNEPAVS